LFHDINEWVTLKAEIKPYKLNHKLLLIALVLIIFLLAEGFSRWTLHYYFERSFRWHIDSVYLRYGLETNSLHADLGIFGGSTVCSDTLRFDFKGEDVETFFCNPCSSTHIDCINLAAPALTIIDSWYLYSSLLKKTKLKKMFFLNGINDARSNNISVEQFDPDYRHIQFYDEAYILFNHPELSIVATPTLFHLAVNKALGKTYQPRQNLHDLSVEDQRRFLSHGSEIKTAEVFETYLKKIVELAQEKKHQIVIGTLPYYQASGYSIEAFWEKKLDYAESIFPTELYGRPKDVVKSIQVHNELVRKLADTNPGVEIIDLEKLIPKEGSYFNDICHLSPAGCELLYRELDLVISEGGGNSE
jgi:hypothetical protein